MKEYVCQELSKIKSSMPKEEQISAMHAIYSFLEAAGYTTADAKDFIDEIIHENLSHLFQKLQHHVKQWSQMHHMECSENYWKFCSSN